MLIGGFKYLMQTLELSSTCKYKYLFIYLFIYEFI